MIERTTSTIKTNLLEGGFLVIVVLLLLLGEISGAIIVALVIPLSMLFAFIGMREFGLAANLMSLGAIDFGMVVDGSVVMVENIVHRLQKNKGKNTDDSIIKASPAGCTPYFLWGADHFDGLCADYDFPRDGRHPLQANGYYCSSSGAGLTFTGTDFCAGNILYCLFKGSKVKTEFFD